MQTTSSPSRKRSQSSVDAPFSLEPGTGLRKRRLREKRVDAQGCETTHSETSARAVPPPLPSQATRAARARAKPLERAREEGSTPRTEGQHPRADHAPLVGARGPALSPATQAAPATALPAAQTPVNVWEFEYPWLEYQRPRLRLLGCLLLLSLCLAAYVHRAALHSHWVHAWPQLQVTWSEVEAIWTQCRAFWAQAWEELA